MTKNGIDVPEQHEQLASFYWLAKLHTKTYGSGFIAASNKCTTKQLSSLLTSCFKTILKPGSQYDAGASVASRASPAKTGVLVHNLAFASVGGVIEGVSEGGSL